MDRANGTQFEHAQQRVFPTCTQRRLYLWAREANGISADRVLIWRDLSALRFGDPWE